MTDDLLKYKIGIGLIPGIGSISAKKLIAYTGSVDAVFAEKKAKLLKIPGIGEFLADSIVGANVLEKAEREIEFMQKYEIRHSFYLDADYPSRLKSCEDSPVMLYCKGEVNFDTQKVLSIVGTRNASDYGKLCCEKLIEDFKLRGHDVLIVSGLAYGIDICAHKASLKNSFDTVAVLGHGLGMIYPALHKSTAKEICKQGALVTDFISDTQPDRNSFVKRNRIIAGLADATLVVESALKGGALITADIAGSYNRDVLACPGRVSDAYSKGCNWLIKTNKAAMVEDINDLEYHLGWETNTKSSLPKQTELFVDITDDERKIVEVLRANNELPIDLICARLDAPMSKVSAQLLNLEFAGMVRSLPGKVYRLVKS